MHLETTLLKLHGTKDSEKHYQRPRESTLFRDTEQVIPNLSRITRVELVQASRSAANLKGRLSHAGLTPRNPDDDTAVPSASLSSASSSTPSNASPKSEAQ